MRFTKEIPCFVFLACFALNVCALPCLYTQRRGWAESTLPAELSTGLWRTKVEMKKMEGEEKKEDSYATNLILINWYMKVTLMMISRWAHCENQGRSLTLSNRHLFSLMAPMQPRKPVTMTMEPRMMTRLAAESEGKEGENVAKLPWDMESQIPTPSRPQPDSWRERERDLLLFHNSYT